MKMNAMTNEFSARETSSVASNQFVGQTLATRFCNNLPTVPVSLQRMERDRRIRSSAPSAIHDLLEPESTPVAGVFISEENNPPRYVGEQAPQRHL